jgi:hypothetical protein
MQLGKHVVARVIVFGRTQWQILVAAGLNFRIAHKKHRSPCIPFRIKCDL